MKTFDMTDSTTTESAAHQPFYKHRSFVVAAVVAIVAVITVLTDLPQHQSRSAQVSAANGVVSEINADVGPCSYAVGEAITVYGDLTAKSLTRSQLGQVPGLLNDDQNACSFVNDSIYQLSTIDPPGGSAGKDVGQLIGTVTLWATSDALSAIESIQTLSTKPGDATASAHLTQAEQGLRSDYDQAQAEIGAADRLLDARITSVDLDKTPVG